MHRLTGVETQPAKRQRSYGFTTAYLVGMLHGAGAETPTQVLLFVATAGAAGKQLGVLLVLVFILGLLISNTIITLMAMFGFIRARKNAPALMVLGGLAAIFSFLLGTVVLFGKGGALPAFFGG